MANITQLDKSMLNIEDDIFNHKTQPRKWSQDVLKIDNIMEQVFHNSDTYWSIHAILWHLSYDDCNNINGRAIDDYQVLYNTLHYKLDYLPV